MVSSLKSTNPTGLDLWIASRGFLRLFTDASNHIPRHRRTRFVSSLIIAFVVTDLPTDASFFSQLVDALGPQEFFAPICMLLADKVANRVVRQNEADSHNSLTLPLVLVQKYGSEIQLSVCLRIFRNKFPDSKSIYRPF